MHVDLTLLLLNAAAVGFIHTLVGPDHYLPFIVLAKARRWSLLKTTWITLACGLAHVGSSIVIGLVGYAFGASLKHLNFIEAVRGEVAAWILIVFGLVYAVWGLRRARRLGPDGHTHSHGGYLHSADHIHDPSTGETIQLTPWILFIIFAFGPCEPLIPLFIYPAATSGWAAAFAVAAVFSVATLVVMLSVVLASSFGLERVPLRAWGRYSHALAGASIALTGGAIRAFGL
ncbi:MAG: sulfite exporter TauE/SafE family protein [Verrucomicrobia bacterium]|nr:sulfite exporter TauE/SafE family protein [Verrucomicrobiota bacterium]